MAFCPDHRKTTLSPSAIMFLLATALAVYFLSRTRWDLAGVTGALALALIANRERLDRLLLRWKAQEFALFPRYKINQQETLQVDLSLGDPDADYVRYRGLSGSLTVSMRLNEEETSGFSRASSKNRYDRIRTGFLRLSNLGRIVPVDDEFKAAIKHPDCALPLVSPAPDQFKALLANKGAFGARLDYTVTLPEESNGGESDSLLPFWILPGITGAEMNSRTWGLEFRVKPAHPRGVVIKSLTVSVPLELEGIEHSDGLYQSEKRLLCWENLKVTPSQPCRVYAEFVRPLHSVARLSGSCRVEIDGKCLSGFDVEREFLWNALGAKVRASNVAVDQSVVVEAQFTTATLLQPKRLEIIARLKKEIPGRVLDTRLAHAVIKRISEGGVYAKYIFEAPSVVAVHEGGSVLRRFWEIIGRQYVKYQPYDIHVVLAGEEPHMGTKGGYQPDLHLEVIVRGFSQVQSAEEKQDVDRLALELETAVTELA